MDQKTAFYLADITNKTSIKISRANRPGLRKIGHQDIHHSFK